MARIKKKIKKVFISSTVYDLKPERKLIRSILEGYNSVPRIRFECYVSDHPDFPINPTDRALKHSYEICLDNIGSSDYYILLLKKRYGDPIIKSERKKISITHREFREARKKKIPRFVLIDKRTWDAKLRYDKGLSQGYIEKKHLPIFDFINEITKRTKGNWVDVFGNKKDIATIINSFLERYDDSTFISDVTIPNGYKVFTGEKFIKKWEIENVGLKVWENRFLREDNQGVSGLIPDSPIVPIAQTAPGERVIISVRFKAPELPATCESYWKMIDKNGNYCFPYKVGLTCCVKVI